MKTILRKEETLHVILKRISCYSTATSNCSQLLDGLKIRANKLVLAPSSHYNQQPDTPSSKNSMLFLKKEKEKKNSMLTWPYLIFHTYNIYVNPHRIDISIEASIC